MRRCPSQAASLLKASLGRCLVSTVPPRLCGYRRIAEAQAGPRGRRQVCGPPGGTRPSRAPLCGGQLPGPPPRLEGGETTSWRWHGGKPSAAPTHCPSGQGVTLIRRIILACRTEGPWLSASGLRDTDGVVGHSSRAGVRCPAVTHEGATVRQPRTVGVKEGRSGEGGAGCHLLSPEWAQPRIHFVPPGSSEMAAGPRELVGWWSQVPAAPPPAASGLGPDPMSLLLTVLLLGAGPGVNWES